MAGRGPLDPGPAVAAAISGGPDSLALTVLLHDWLAERGGRLATFTVDHGLRPDSAREAASVGRLLRRHGIAHRVLRWTGPKPTAGRQAAARAARSEEHTSELQSLMRISYAVFCLKKKTRHK